LAVFVLAVEPPRSDDRGTVEDLCQTPIDLTPAFHKSSRR
jgi:hypothetical protein